VRSSLKRPADAPIASLVNCFSDQSALFKGNIGRDRCAVMATFAGPTTQTLRQLTRSHSGFGGNGK